MKFTIKRYKVQKVEISSKEIELPSEPAYFFETGIRRSIRIIPVFTTWNQVNNIPEEIYQFDITCVYLSFKCRVEKFTLTPEKIEELYYNEKLENHSLVFALFNGWVEERTKEQFDEDLNRAIDSFKSCHQSI